MDNTTVFFTYEGIRPYAREAKNILCRTIERARRIKINKEV